MDDLRAHGANRAYSFLQELQKVCEDQSSATAAAVIIKGYPEREQNQRARADFIKDVEALREYVRELELQLMQRGNFYL